MCGGRGRGSGVLCGGGASAMCVCDTPGVCGCGGESNLYMSKLNNTHCGANS